MAAPVIWLPLNGDINNIGTGTLEKRSGTDTYRTDAKIGAKCFDLSSAVTFYSAEFANTSNTGFTICFWMKVDSSTTLTGNWVDLCAFTDAKSGQNNGTFRFEACYASSLRACSWHDNATYNVIASATTNSVTMVADSEKNKWHHCCVTMGEDKVCSYVDGALINDTARINSGGYFTGVFSLGQTSAIAGGMNDFRIYNTTLSQKEVKEISQGLILHYPLNNSSYGLDNILINTNFDTRYSQTTGWDTNKNGTLLASSWGGYNSGVTNQATVYHAHLKEVDNEYVYEFIKTNDEGWLGISQGGLQNKLTAGETYTFSWEEYHTNGTNRVGTGLYYYKSGASSAAFHLGIQQASNITRESNKWQKFTYTFTAPNDADWTKNMSWYIYGHYNGNGTFYVRHPKLEKGSMATVWSPAPSDKIYSVLKTDINIIPDSSGFNHNGLLIGSPIYTNISYDGRYIESLQFDGNEQGIQLQSPDFNTFFNNVWTISFWTYTTNENGARSIYFSSYNASPFWCVEKTTSNAIRYDWNGSPDLSGTSNKIMDNTWNHIVLVKYSNTSCKSYINGVFDKEFTSTVSNLTINNPIWRIGRDNRTGTTCLAGNISDFRIYATALSEADIKELYNIPVSIDNLYNVHSYEINEIGLTKIYKNGIIQSDEFNEADDTTHFGKDFIITNEFIEK